jgi:putative ABC transport system permease protein
VFSVRGIMSPKGMAMAFGGNIGIMDIYAAQFLFDQGRFFDRFDIDLQDGSKIDEVLPRLQATLSHGFKIEPPRRQ